MWRESKYIPYKNTQSKEAKESQNRRNKKYYKKHKGRLLEERRPTRKKYYQNNKDKWEDASSRSTINRRKRLYGVDEDMYNEIIKKQSGKCIICNSKKEDEKKGLYVDHCHKTGKVRGLLCDRCNRGLGFFRDNVYILKKAITYLES